MKLSRRTAFARIALAASPAVLAACTTGQQCEPKSLVTLASFNAWLERYKKAWEERDAKQAGALFTEDATYHEMPFDAVKEGRAAVEAYWSEVTATQSDIQFAYDVISTEADTGVAHWHATFKAAPDNSTIDLDGVFVCKFVDENTVSALREWWHVKVTPAA